MKKKVKQVHPTKEQLVEDVKRKQEVSRKKDILINKFYPALEEATVSIDEAKMLISAISSLMMEEVLSTMKILKFSAVIDNLHTKLCADGQRSEEVKKLLTTLEGENLYVAREILEGVTRSIETMITAEMRDRKLFSLKTNWDLHLN